MLKSQSAMMGSPLQTVLVSNCVLSLLMRLWVRLLLHPIINWILHFLIFGWRARCDNLRTFTLESCSFLADDWAQCPDARLNFWLNFWAQNSNGLQILCELFLRFGFSFRWEIKFSAWHDFIILTTLGFQSRWWFRILIFFVSESRSDFFPLSQN